MVFFNYGIYESQNRIEFRYGEDNLLDLTNFNNLKKLVLANKLKIKTNLYDTVVENKIISDYLKPNTLNVISSSVKKIYCVHSNISHITNLPTTLTHLKCSNNNILSIKYLPQTLKVLELSNCNLEFNFIKLNNFYLPELEVLKINSNDIKIIEIKEFIPHSNNLKIFECTNNKLSSIDLVAEYAKKIQILKCGSNQLTKLDNLSLGLKILDCSHNLITQLDNLPTGIEILNCSYNKLVKLDYLPSGIIKLNCSYNNLVNLDNLPNSIKFLIIISTDITQLENLPSNITNLKIVKCDKFSNQILNSYKNLEKVIIINNNKNTLVYNNYDNLIKLPKIKSVIVKTCFRYYKQYYCVYGPYCLNNAHLIKYKTINLIKQNLIK